ncbi:TPA: phage tail protein [Kluyvera ascorbata]|nr:phage tail protein [Kluyvera ascorbata]
MFHLDNNSGVSAMPPLGAVQSSAPRWFTEGGGGVPASYPGAAWFNMIQAELLNLCAAYGITPDKANLNQLKLAIEAAVNQRAPLASPAFTGVPTAPTAGQSTNNTQIATTAFVKTALAALVDSSLAALANKQDKDATLTALSGKDVAGLLQYLGLGGVASGTFAIGMPFYWPSAKMPNELLPEWSGMTFLKWNDATFSATAFPKLALVIPSLKLTESRGEFIRNWDDGRGVDSGRVLLSFQSDAAPNIYGEIGMITRAGAASPGTGAFLQTTTTNNSNEGGTTRGINKVIFSASDSNSIYGRDNANEIRTRSVAFNFLVRAA